MRKRIFKLLACLFAVCLFASSCSMAEANVYNYWKSGDTEYLPKDHIVTKISTSKAEKMIRKQNEDSERIYIFYGQTDSATSRTAIQIYNEQAVQYEISRLYWIDSNISDSKKDNLEEKLGVSNADVYPALYVFYNGSIEFDSGRPYYANDSKFTTIKIAEIAFKHLYDENGKYED